jgi:sialidase-1
MPTSRRDFIKSAGIASALLGAGSVYGREPQGKESVYYDQEIITVCKADKDFPRHSEASIIELNDSTLLMAWQRFEGSKYGSGDNAPGTIALMNSSDGGRTWGNFRIAAERQDENSVNVYSPNFLRLNNGEILLCYMEYNQLTAGKPKLATAYMIRSNDEGKTFGPPETIWQKDRLAMSNSCITRLSSGRVAMPVCYSAGEVWSPTEKIHVRVLYSDDDCRTWVFGQQNISLPMRGAMEPFIAEIKDGRLIMVMRNQLGSLFKSYSENRGESWSLPQTTGLSIPESCPYVTTLPGNDKIMVIWNNSEYNMHWRSHYGKRSPLTAAISADGGVTFTDFWNIETDPKTAFSNPGITWTKDGVCLLTYWACPYTEDWVMSGLIDLKLARFRVRT